MGIYKGIEGKGGGHGQNALLPPLSHEQNSGGGGRASAAPIPRTLGHGGERG